MFLLIKVKISGKTPFIVTSISSFKKNKLQVLASIFPKNMLPMAMGLNVYAISEHNNFFFRTKIFSLSRNSSSAFYLDPNYRTPLFFLQYPNVHFFKM